jgi:CheY-like chemotaxis protein
MPGLDELTEAPPRARVLLVDDEELVRTVLTDLLSLHHDVVSVDSGRAALSELSTGQFDVVLCDVMMQEMTGVDVYRHIAATRPGLERRFVFITGGVFTVELEAFLASSGNRVLLKPFPMEALHDAIADAQGVAQKQRTPAATT